MIKIILKSKYWLLINAVGIAVFLYLGSQLWPDLAQQDIPLDMRPEFAIPFLARCVPICLFFFLVNTAWLIQVILVILRRRLRCISSCFLLMIWLLVGVAWVFAWKYNFDRLTLENPRWEEMRKNGKW